MHHALDVTVDPAALGFDPARLERIGRHFDGYVDRGNLAGYLTLVSRGGVLAYVAKGGHRDREAGHVVTDDTLWRIYSMTKPITSVALMMLFEEGLLGLNDPVATYLPEFEHPQVFVGGTSTAPLTVPSREPMRIWHLLTHTAGLTYGFNYTHPVDAIYRHEGFAWGYPKDCDLEDVVKIWAAQPLLFEPGTGFNYSVATDVLGRIIEVISGQRLDAFFQQRIFDPLSMVDTGFFAQPDDDRLAMLYVPSDGQAVAFPDLARPFTRPPRVHSGGGGLVATARDYERFCQMLLRGGELDGVRLLGPRTVELMVTNQLPGDVDLSAFARDGYNVTEYCGHGFGLGFAVVMDPVPARYPTSAGTYYWGGAASTAFWNDPIEDLTVAFYTQLLPSGNYPIRQELSQLVSSALVD